MEEQGHLGCQGDLRSQDHLGLQGHLCHYTAQHCTVASACRYCL